MTKVTDMAAVDSSETAPLPKSEQDERKIEIPASSFPPKCESGQLDDQLGADKIVMTQSVSTVHSESSSLPFAVASGMSFSSNFADDESPWHVVRESREDDPTSSTSTAASFPTLLSQRPSMSQVFKAFCGARSEMDGRSFAKLCRECGFLDKQFTIGEADLLFTKVSHSCHRRIDFDQFLSALEEMARKKGVEVNSLYVAVERSVGPVLHGTKASAVRLHDDKSTYTGCWSNAKGGPHGGIKGKGGSSYRSVTNISSGASADPTASFAAGLETRIAKQPSPQPLSTKTVAAPGGHMRLPSSSGDEGSVEDTFRAYSQNGEHMDGKSFAKLCKDCSLLGQGLTETDVDLIFAKFKSRNLRHMSISQFKGALRCLATKKSLDAEAVFGMVAASDGPVLTGTKAGEVRFYDDATKSIKTTVDLDDEQSWRLTLRPNPKHERLPRFVAQRVGDLPEPQEQLNARAMLDFQRERRRLRDSVKSRPPLDTDQVTMVFTDVQGSTSLWEANPKAMEQALRLHDATIRLNLAKHDGYEVTTEGDAFQVVFHDAFDAVGFCLDVQRDLLSCEWPEETLKHPDACASSDGAWRGLRVRMGMHTGRPLPPTKHEVTGRSRYAGRSVAIAKAVEEMCEGGQILVSGDTFSQINGLLTQLQSPQVIDLGEHVLQAHGLASHDAEVRLLQLVPAEIAHDHFSDPACSSRGSSCCLGGRVFPSLDSKVQLSPGFHAAPAGGSITLCFVFTKGARDLVASDPNLATHALGMLRKCVRELLTASGSGYECQEDEGAFMLAFSNLSETAAFASALQQELAQLPWQDELRACSPAFAQGLRVGIGALHGSYTSRGPHTTTGRADYFGTIVNRTARIAQGAHAGQVLFGVDPQLPGSPRKSKQGLLLPNLSRGATLERLGAYSFKGIEGPLVIHALRTPGSDGQFEIFPEPKSKGRVGN
jgi:class 3 adenylate cyclase